MFIELVDALRCPRPHEESWLVVASTRMEHRHIVTGVLGCPVCRAEYPIAEGVVDFRVENSILPTDAHVAGADDAERLAAFMGLTDGSGFAVLVGTRGACASALRGLVETPLVLVDPHAGRAGEPGISVIRTDGPIPLASSSARGVAFDAGERAADAARIARNAGRIVAPASVDVPPEVRELARDDRDWVGERDGAVSAPVTLHVRRG